MPRAFLILLTLATALPMLFAAPAPGDEKPAVSLSVEEAVSSTLKNNFDLILRRIAANTAREDRIVAEAEFDPALNVSLSAGQTRNPSTSAFAIPDIIETGEVGGEVAVSKKTALGGEYTLGVQAEQLDTNSIFQSIDPTYTTALKLDIEQPLLKDAGRGVNLWRIRVGENNEAIALEELRVALNDIITKTHEQYWEYVFATENLTVQREFLERAKDLERRVRVQVDVGSMAPIEIIQAQASVASREQLVITAENEVERVADQLLRLMNPPHDAPAWDSLIRPTSSPDLEPRAFDLASNVQVALAGRPEIRALKKQLENKNVELIYYENQKWPRLDLVGTFRANGVRGTAQPVQSFTDEEVLLSKLDGGLRDSFSDAASGDFYDYTVGLKLVWPIGNRSARSAFAKAGLDVQTEVVNLKSLERDVTLEVRDALRQIRTGQKQIEAASVARLLAEKKLEAEIRKFEVGSSTSFNVLEFQKDLAAERSKELRARVDYRKAVTLIDKAVGRTLEANGISFEAVK